MSILYSKLSAFKREMTNLFAQMNIYNKSTRRTLKLKRARWMICVTWTSRCRAATSHRIKAIWILGKTKVYLRAYSRAVASNTLNLAEVKHSLVMKWKYRVVSQTISLLWSMVTLRNHSHCTLIKFLTIFYQPIMQALSIRNRNNLLMSLTF